MRGIAMELNVGFHERCLPSIWGEPLRHTIAREQYCLLVGESPHSIEIQYCKRIIIMPWGSEMDIIRE
ncbi:hypothetical protein I7I48_10370 [Histoplasma ohiense]|nr:hypothetical protein I7I48_10370 [Histoplasma ohiense (nom. inval.)]